MQELPTPGVAQEESLVKHLQLRRLDTLTVDLARLLRLAPHLQSLTVSCRNLEIRRSVRGAIIDRNFHLNIVAKEGLSARTVTALHGLGLRTHSMGRVPAGKRFRAVSGNAVSFNHVSSQPSLRVLQGICCSIFHYDGQCSQTIDSYMRFVDINRRE